MRKCISCGTTNMLMKRDKEWICLPCFSKSRPVESELGRIIEDCIENGLIYISVTYKRKLRKLEKEKLAKGEI